MSVYIYVSKEAGGSSNRNSPAGHSRVDSASSGFCDGASYLKNVNLPEDLHRMPSSILRPKYLHNAKTIQTPHNPQHRFFDAISEVAVYFPVAPVRLNIPWHRASHLVQVCILRIVTFEMLREKSAKAQWGAS